MVKHKIPGLAVAVVKNGRILKLKGFGVASVEFDVPMKENTIFQLFSVSKIFTGVAAMRMIQEEKLSLEAPVTDFIERLPADWKAIQVRHLLTHTSGLPEMSANPRFRCLSEDQKRRVTVEEEIGFIAEMPLKFRPGERFSYHQSGYRLLGMMIQKLTKRAYSDFLQENIFSPLEMTSTRFGGTESIVIKGRSSTSYSRESGDLRAWIYPFSMRDYPAAGLNSSASDLAKFFIALDAGKILSTRNLQVLWSPMKVGEGAESNYGLGWTLGNYKGRRVVGHEGGGAIWVAHFPSEHLSIIVLCNLNGARADEIQYGIADLYL
jgi:CubicO group peptidase (beta-lactamase class C family)